MKTVYLLMFRAPGTNTYVPRGAYDTMREAAYAAPADANEWSPIWQINVRTGNAYVDTPVGDWQIIAERVAETDAERIELAIEVGYAYGQITGDRHKMWVIDQMIRHLAGDRYDTIIDDKWDAGIAP